MRPKLVIFALGSVLVSTLGFAVTRPLILADARYSQMRQACCLGDTEIIKALLRRGEDVNAPVWEDWTALMYAADNARPDAVRVLIGVGADVSAETGHGFTALNLARGHQGAKARAVVSILVAAGAKR